MMGENKIVRKRTVIQKKIKRNLEQEEGEMMEEREKKKN